MLLTCHDLASYAADLTNSCDQKNLQHDTYTGRLGWLNAKSEHWPDAMDGATEKSSEVSNEQRPVSASKAEEPTAVEKALSPPVVPTRPRGNTVADRIRSINETRSSSRSGGTKIEPGGADDPSKLHRKSSNLKRRMNPFVRRDADAKPLDIQSPVAQSKDPLRAPAIYSPKPQRNIGVPTQQIEPVVNKLDTSRGDSEASNVRSGFGRRRSKYFERGIRPVPDPTPPAGQIMCPRHGRRLKSKQSVGATTEGFDRSLSGAYIPSARKLRHQVDITSPWHILANRLTKTEGTSVSPEPCPDCIAEEEIKRREHHEHDLHSDHEETTDDHLETRTDMGSTVTQPGTPMPEAIVGPTVVGTSDDYQTVGLPGAAVTDARSHQIGTLVAADLGDMIDAIIIEHRGALDRVITNLRNGNPGPANMQQLSKDLVTVSREVELAAERPCALLEPDQRFSIILDTPPEFLKSRTKSVPDLLDFIDSAAQDLGFSLSGHRSEPVNIAVPGPSITLSPSEHQSVPNDGSSVVVATKSLAPSRAASPEIANTAYATPIPSPMNSPALTPYDMPTAPNVNPFSAVPTPLPGLPGSLPDPMSFAQPLTPTDSSTVSPSTIPTVPGVALSINQDVSPVSAPPATNTGVTNDMNSRPQIESEAFAPTPPSRIPSLKSLTTTVTAPRKHLDTPVNPSTPWTKDSKAEWAAMKPSLVKERQKLQGSFAQPWTKEMVKDASWKERLQRRARVGGDAGKE